MKRTENSRFLSLGLNAAVLLGVGQTALAQPAMRDARLQVAQVADGLGGGQGQIATGFVFVDADTILAARRGDGKVVRLDLLPGQVVTPGPFVADLDIVSPTGNDSQTEYGVQGICLHPNFATNGYVYIRYDLSPTPGVDTAQSVIATQPNFSVSLPTQNVTDRFVWDPAANAGAGALTFDTRIISTTFDTRYHHGGGPRFGNDGKLYIPTGDLRRVTWIPGHAGLLISANYAGTTTADLAVILRLNDDGTTPAGNPFASTPGAGRWFAYGIRNSWALSFDPLTGTLWNTDNGEGVFDEINLVFPGLNSGHGDVMGPVGHPDQEGSIAGIVNLPGSTYADPKFSWLGTVGITAIRHLYASALGAAFNNAVLVGNVNTGNLWMLRLNAARNGFVFNNPGLQDGVNDAGAFENPLNTEAAELLAGTGFGGLPTGALAIELGPDRLPYVLTATGRIYRISRITPCPADLTGDDLVNTADLTALLGAFGNSVIVGAPGDIQADGVVNTIDLTAFLSAFGQSCQ